MLNWPEDNIRTLQLFPVNAARSHARKLLSINETFSVTELGISIAEFNATTPDPENITNISSSNITANANVEIEANCTRPAIHEFPQDGFTRSQRKHGAVAIHIFLACYCFWLLAVICDDYFVPSIEVMCFSKYFDYCLWLKMVKFAHNVHTVNDKSVRTPHFFQIFKKSIMWNKIRVHLYLKTTFIGKVHIKQN